MYLLIPNYSDDRDIMDAEVFRNLADLEDAVRETYLEGIDLEEYRIVKISMTSAHTPTVTLEVNVEND
jgi:hypothetical protein